MGKDFKCFHYVTDCHGLLSGVLCLQVTEQVEFGSELAPLLPFSMLSFTRFGLTQCYLFFCLVAWSTFPTAPPFSFYKVEVSLE